MLSSEMLKIIHTVASYGSFSTAAEQLYKVPSAISYSIKKAEEELGFSLFDRSGRKIQLTEAGKYFIQNSQWMMTSFNELVKNACLIDKGIEAKFTIAINNIIHTDGLINLSRQFIQKFPASELTIRTEVYNGCWDALYAKRADLVIGAPHYSPQIQDICFQSIGYMEWDFIVSRHHPLATCTEVLTATQLREFPVVLVKDTALNISQQNAWALEGQKKLFVPELTTAINMIRNNVGIGYIPHHRIKSLLDQGEVIKKAITDQKQPTQLFYAWYKHGCSPILDWCIDYLNQPQHLLQWCR